LNICNLDVLLSSILSFLHVVFCLFGSLTNFLYIVFSSTIIAFHCLFLYTLLFSWNIAQFFCLFFFFFFKKVFFFFFFFFFFGTTVILFYMVFHSFDVNSTKSMGYNDILRLFIYYYLHFRTYVFSWFEVLKVLGKVLNF